MAKARIAIIGAGLMGHGLAQVFAVAGHRVSVYDSSAESLATLRERITRNLASLGLPAAAVKRVKPAATIAEAAADANFIIEAAPEKLELKQAIFAELEKAAPRDAILASNTSVIPIGKIMARVKTRHRTLGTHWFNPPYLVPLVEVIEAKGTAPESVATAMKLLAAAGKTPVHVKKDVPGFIANRLQHALWREAIALVQNGVCDARTVDTVVKSSFGRRLPVIGPLENADLVGTDLTLDIHNVILPDLDRTAGPLPYLKSLVTGGKLGFKTGEGFRTWTEAEKQALREGLISHLVRMANELDRSTKRRTRETIVY
jgi:3-hydroxybutyryl-CoA dehydrogenase